MEKSILKNALLSAGCIIQYNLSDPDNVEVIRPEQVRELEKQYRRASRLQASKPDPFLEQIRVINTIAEALNDRVEQHSFKQSCIV